ncbi:MAG: hypothetical protein ACI83O_000407 [Patescibacteria group bacterium]|jgi:hypothetical protein
MKRAVIAIIISLVFLIIPVFSADTVTQEISVKEGWNLVNGLSNVEQISGGDISSDNIKAIYIVLQPDQEYVRLYPERETSKLERISQSYYTKTPQWVYTDKAGVLEFQRQITTLKQSLMENQIYTGWNIMTIKEEFKGLTLYQLKGTCSMKDLFAFDTELQDWSKELFSDNYINDTLDDKHMNQAIAMRVEEPCTMFASEEQYQNILEGRF